MSSLAAICPANAKLANTCAAGTYQPETIYRIFMRSMFGTDIATGEEKAEGYQSQGPMSVRDVKNVLPPSPPVRCNVWEIPTSCTPNQVAALMNGSAEVVDSIVIDPAE